MKRALIIGHSGGIGRALDVQLQRENWQVTGLSRSTHGLDVTREDSLETVLAPLEAPFQRIIVATGALEIAGHAPEKALRQVSARGMADQFAVNAMGPMLVLKHAMRLLPRREPASFTVLSARVGSIGDNRLGGWHSYRAAKAALNQLIHSASIELARSHRQLCVACLHPGTVQTRFTADYQSRHPSIPAQEAATRIVSVLDRLTPAHSGGFYDNQMAEIPW